LTKTSLIYSIPYFNLRGLAALFVGLSPPKPLVATGLSRPRLILKSQKLRSPFTSNCKEFGKIERKKLSLIILKIRKLSKY